ncbi:hypothetical protein GCM10022276_17630 [Sphingomonas limnosediminicola]|uniref:Inner membrane protein n=1 Tax=Sphingomonas limnosediminicola TaxID=940133 RepID=A0ABP7LFC3_9SPHN
MNGTSYRRQSNWGTRLLVGFVLVLAGAAAATWGLAHYKPAARVLGVAAEPAPVVTPKSVALSAAPSAPPAAAPAPTNAQVNELEARLARVENATQRAEGFAGRADALVVAFAARRAIDRGVALGYLEPLLVDRFGNQHQQAVATVITGSHQPVRLNDLIAEYDALGPELRRGGAQDNWWTNFRRELGTLIEVHRAERPAANPDARYQRAAQRLQAGDVDQALAETMRLPGASRAGPWVDKARRYVAAHRALDEIESAALLGSPTPQTAPAR